MKRKWITVVAMIASVSSMVMGASAEETEKTLTVWSWDQNGAALEELASRYNNATGANISLDVVQIASEDSRNRLVTIVESGDMEQLPDILLLEDTCMAQFISTYPDAFVELTDYDINWNDIVPSKKAFFTVNDGYWAIPMDSAAVVALYRTDYLEKAGYTIDDLTDITWDEFITIGKDVYDKTGHYILVDDANNCYVARSIYSSCGGQFFNEDGKATLNTDLMKTTLEMIKKLVDNNCLYIAGSFEEYVGLMNDGTAAGVINGNWVNGCVNQETSQSGKWGVTMMPVLAVEGATHYSNCNGASWVVTAGCEDAQAVVDFLSYELCGKGAQDAWEYLCDFAGYTSTLLPVLQSGYYETVDNEFFGPDYYATVAECAQTAPVFNTSPYYMDAINAVSIAVNNVAAGGNIEDEMDNAQETLEFSME